jgi:beta-galactosidase
LFATLATGLLLLAGGAAAGSLRGEELRSTIELPRGWKVQPAASPETPPDAANWGRTTSGAWKDGASRQGTRWQSVNLTAINSLWFEQELAIPAAWRGKSVVADFSRIEGDAIIFLNDRRVCELLRPGGEVDLTAFADFGGRNTLRIYLTRDYTGISRSQEQDVLRRYVRARQRIPMNQWGLGITAPVTLTARSATAAVTDVFVIPSWRKKQLGLEVEVAAAQPVPSMRVVATVFDALKKPVLKLTSDPLSLPAGRSVHTLSAPWADPMPWELDQPYLYTTEVRLEVAGKTIDAPAPVTFGFREIWADGNKLFMNGHLSRWRLTEIYGATKQGLSMYRLLGYNVGQLQPHGDLWWCATWAPETPLFSEELLAEMDRLGMGVTLPAPSVAYLRENFRKEGVAEAYDREVGFFLKKYRNHPCLLAWVVAINSYVPQSAIEPEKMGVRETNPKGQAKVINDAVAIVHKWDPTRLAFAHADGSTGDIATANTYLNFVPLQERKEWPKAWASQGNMPYSAVEFGAPFSANYWKGKQFLLTEYLAMYLGDRAYLDETEEGLRKSIDYGLLNKGGFGSWGKIDLDSYPRYWDFLGLFVKETNRSWRTWGINAGWLYWLIGERYGHPTKASDVKNYEELNYNFLKEPLTEKPSWASPNFDTFRQANQPLLTYIAGSPVHTDKTHGYYAGETMKKQIAVVWDGAAATALEAGWTLKDGDKTLASGKETLRLAAGEIRLAPIEITLPKQVAARTPLTLELTVRQDGKTNAVTDRFPLEVFPQPPAPARSAVRLALYDPLGKSTDDLKKLGINPTPWKPGAPLDNTDLLIIGREALKPGDPLPYKTTDIRNGLKVLVLEQQPQVWRSLGFETIETMPRYVFARDTASPLFAGLNPEDLVNWRGSPDLLPEGRQAVSSDAPHAPKWTNRHAVASVALKTPHVAGFTPLIETEFDLAYTPLLQWREGKGAVYFSSLDFSGRLGADPAATLLAGNLIKTISSTTLPATKPVYYLGGDAGLTRLRQLGVEAIRGIPAKPITDALLVVGVDPGTPPADQLNAFAQAGGTVLHLMRPADELQTRGLHTTRRTIYRASPAAAAPLLRGMGPNLLRWQDALEVNAFTPDNQSGGATVLADGLLLEKKTGKGRDVYLQASPSLLEGRYADNTDKREAIQLSLVRLDRLVAQLLTNLGADPAADVSRRLAESKKPAAIATLGSWRVMGPHISAKTKPHEILGESFSGQWEATRGAENPNTLHKRADGVVLDWRKTADAGKNGYVDLEPAMGSAHSSHVGYATRNVDSDEDRTVTLSLGVDYWLQAWVNGQSVIKVDESHGTPVPGAFKTDVKLKKGKNTLTLKVVSGSNGFGFWCQIKSKDSGPTADDTSPDAGFYTPLFKPFDPYLFTYW